MLTNFIPLFKSSIPLHPDVITAFRKIRPEVKDLPIEIAATQQELTASISRVIREETADTAILTGITHTSVVYVHRSAGGNALFLLDSVGAPLLQVKLIRGLRSDPELVKLLTAERFEVGGHVDTEIKSYHG